MPTSRGRKGRGGGPKRSKRRVHLSRCPTSDSQVQVLRRSPNRIGGPTSTVPRGLYSSRLQGHFSRGDRPDPGKVGGREAQAAQTLASRSAARATKLKTSKAAAALERRLRATGSSAGGVVTGCSVNSGGGGGVTGCSVGRGGDGGEWGDPCREGDGVVILSRNFS
jgi:hypothetical protein